MMHAEARSREGTAKVFCGLRASTCKNQGVNFQSVYFAVDKLVIEFSGSIQITIHESDMTAKKTAKAVNSATKVSETTKEKIGHMAENIGHMTGNLASKAKDALSGIGHAIVDHLPGRGAKKTGKKAAKKATKSVKKATAKGETVVAKKVAKVAKVAKKTTNNVAKKAAR